MTIKNILSKNATDITKEEWTYLYNQLSPENQRLFRLKIYELLAEQEAQEAQKT